MSILEYSVPVPLYLTVSYHGTTGASQLAMFAAPMRPGQVDYACNTTPHWYHAPVIVGGSGGSGSRGVVLLLERLGVKMACTEPPLENKSVCTLHCNGASDCELINTLRPAPTDANQGALGWLANIFSQAHSCDVNPERVRAP